MIFQLLGNLSLLKWRQPPLLAEDRFCVWEERDCVHRLGAGRDRRRHTAIGKVLLKNFRVAALP